MGRKRYNAATEITLIGTQSGICEETGLPSTVGNQLIAVPCWVEFVADRSRELTKRAFSDERITELRGVVKEQDVPAGALRFLFDSSLRRFWMSVSEGVVLFGEGEFQPLGTPSLVRVRKRLGVPFTIRGRSNLNNIGLSEVPSHIKGIFQ